MFNLDQIMIALLGPLAIWLSQDSRHSVQRWACIIGLISQPFWFHASFIAGQYGIIVAHFMYLYSWLRGLRTYWFAKETPHENAKE